MPETTTSQVQEQGAPVPAPTPVAKAPKGKKNPKRVKRLIIGGAAAIVLVVGGVVLYRFLTKQNDTNSEIQSQPVEIGSIQSTVSGSGTATAKESAAITLTAGGTVREVYVTSGDTVTAGQPLYTIFSQDAQDLVDAAKENLDKLNKDMADLQDEAANLTVRAPFAGKLQDVQTFESDQDVSKGATVATLVNDKKLKLSLYFSYAYENEIKVGQSVEVSIPAVMRTFTGSVEKINKVSYISPEGAVHFEAVIVFDNPGTLTAGMDASAVLTAKDGTQIYPYQNGKTEFYETRTITAKASGPVSGKGNLLNYANVSAGEALLYLGSSTIDSDIRAKQEEISNAQDKLVEAQKGLDNFNAVSPIDGTVTSCTLVEGEDVKSGDTVITISNTSVMVVEITVDDKNISFVQPGMSVNLTDWNNNTYMGTVTSINMAGATSQNGMTNYPVTLTVDNYGGSLISGMWLDYSFVASQSDDCMMVPMQSVKYVSDANGDTYSVVFIQADSKPDNTVELDIPETQPGEMPSYPTEADGFYPVPVETGLSDTYNIEITSGLNGDETVFVQYYNANQMNY
ncbi:MAG: HlyD family efflux transporter periplasmic adaptor subunit [Clostridiales bacterium]|nr:HlyD family efflux transporter periplasmic adaptor subunit [Clostridiales bacterium]